MKENEERCRELLEAAEKACELLEGYVGVADGPGGEPVANKAMRAVQGLQDAIRKAQGGAQ